mmetsp:Transcript_22946/g.65628  ORF Transcript_22946/g.65628 Transcript_22946/m.65628 type:complete len:171 (+) Transcript_22946:114-626(+)
MVAVVAIHGVAAVAPAQHIPSPSPFPVLQGPGYVLEDVTAATVALFSDLLRRTSHGHRRHGHCHCRHIGSLLNTGVVRVLRVWHQHHASAYVAREAIRAGRAGSGGMRTLADMGVPTHQLARAMGEEGDEGPVDGTGVDPSINEYYMFHGTKLDGVRAGDFRGRPRPIGE